jgi:hypothetical protein
VRDIGIGVEDKGHSGSGDKLDREYDDILDRVYLYGTTVAD